MTIEVASGAKQGQDDLHLKIRFERKMIEGQKYPCVYLNLHGLGTGYTDLKPEVQEALLTFPVSTFKLLKDKDSALNWPVIFGTVEIFLDTMTPEERERAAHMYITMHAAILNVLGQKNPPDKDVVDLETKLSQTLAAFDQEVDLINRLIAFTQTHIPIQSFTGVGERPQDSPEMTFYRQEMVELTAVALLCKMMTPVFGLFIDLYGTNIDKSNKEVHCVAILKDILHNRCEKLMNKVTHFISRIIKTAANKISLTHVYNGYTFTTITSTIYSQAFTKRFVGVDFYATSSNLVTYLTSCARYAVSTQLSPSAFTQAVAEIKLPEERSSGDDDGNISGLEVESRVSTKTADYPILVKAAARELLTRFPAEYELDEELIDEAQRWYEVNHISLTPANEYLLGIVFGSHLCGAKSIDALDGLTLSKIMPILQAFLLQQGYFNLVPLVSLQQTGQVKTILNGPDTKLRSLWNSSFEYRNCDAKFNYCVDKLRWDSGLKSLVENITEESYRLNLAPCFWDKLNISNQNGEIYITSENIAKEICSLISQLYP